MNYIKWKIYYQKLTLLFFPEGEKSNVDELISALDKQNIDIHICKGEHGFNDPYSPIYNVESAQNTFKETLDFFRTNWVFISQPTNIAPLLIPEKGAILENLREEIIKLFYKSIT